MYVILITVLIIAISMISSATTAIIFHRKLDTHVCPPCDHVDHDKAQTIGKHARHRAHHTRLTQPTEVRQRPKFLSEQSIQPPSETSSTMTPEAVKTEPKTLLDATSLHLITTPRSITVSPLIQTRYPSYLHPTT